MTREEWLENGVELLRDWYTQHGYPIPDKVRVSVGFPRGSRKAIGQCWHANAAQDGIQQIFVSPVLIAADSVLSTLAHELGHAAIDPHKGHAGKFVSMMRAVGLEGKPTSCGAGPELKEHLRIIAARLGDYPHAALNPSEIAKQTTRLIKVSCGQCGYTVRVTRKWLDIAAPTCTICQEVMREDV